MKNPICILFKPSLFCFIVTVGLSIFIFNPMMSQSTLSPGDIVFTGYNADDPAANDIDQFSFVLLVDIQANTEVFFTDFGWTGTQFQSTPATCGANGGSAADGIVKWVSTSAMTCGTQVIVNCMHAVNATIGTATGFEANFNPGGGGTVYMSLPAGGDHVFAYQGSKGNPSFIAGISMQFETSTNSPWVSSLNACTFTSGQSVKPTAIASSIVEITPEVDNAIYGCSIVTGSPSVIASAILFGASNWSVDNSTRFTLGQCTYTCQAGAPNITMQPQDAQICTGLSGTISVTASNVTNYIWQVDTGGGFNNISGGPYTGQSSASLTITNVTGLNGAQYRCVMSGPGGSATTTPATLTVLQPPTITSQPISTTTCVNCQTGFQVTVLGTALTYQWQVNSGGGFGNIVNGANYSGATTNKLIITNTPSGFNANAYRVIITGTCTPSVTSNSITLTVTGSPTVLATGEVGFVGYNGDGELLGVDDEFSFILLEDINAGTNIFFTDFGWTNSNNFQSASAAVSDGTISWIATSDMVCGTEIHVQCKNNLIANSGIVVGITGTFNDASEYLNLSSGGDQIFAFQNTGGFTLLGGIHMNGPWDVSYPAGEFNSGKSVLPPALTDGQSAIAVVDPEEDNAIYDCNSGSTGPPSSLASLVYNNLNWVANSATIYPLPIMCNFNCSNGPQITSQPQSMSICNNDPASFTVTANNVTSYEWQINTGGGFVPLTNGTPYSGVTTNTLNISSVSGLDGNVYRCFLSNGMGSSTSVGATISVLFPPAPTVNVGTVTTCNGCMTAFNISASGDGVNYQWQVNSGGGFVNISLGDGNYSGANTTKLIINNPTTAFNGNMYRCLLSGDCPPQVLSGAGTLVVTAGAGTSLSAGDIGFVAYNADETSTSSGDDEFSFITFTDILAGTAIFFTDRGWTNNNVFQSSAAAVSDGVIKWVATADYECGTEVTVQAKFNLLSSTGSVIGIEATSNSSTEWLSHSSGGDHLFAYQGSYAAPTLLSGLSMNGAWDASLPAGTFTSGQSVLPSSLTTGTSAMAISPEVDNAVYDCANQIIADIPSILRPSIYNPSNWITNNTTAFSLPLNCGFSCSFAPIITTQPQDVTLCPGNPAMMSIAATNATSYQWEVNTGAGFVSVGNGSPYSGGSTATLSISDITGLNGYQYRCLAQNAQTFSISNTVLVTELPCPLNDLCVNAQEVFCGDVILGSTNFATNEIHDDCFGGLTDLQGVWYKIIGNGSQTILSTCSVNTTFDTEIRVFEGNCSNFICAENGFNDDDFSCPINTLHSRIEFFAQLGREYHIWVAPYFTGQPTGDFELFIDCSSCNDLADSDQDGIPACFDLCPNTSDRSLDFDEDLINYIEISHSANLNFVDGDFSFEAWVNPQKATFNTIISKGEGSNAINTTFILNLWTDGRIALYLSDGSFAEWKLSQNSAPLNQWSHIAASVDNSNGVPIVSFYLNGVLDGTESYALTSGLLYNNDANPMYIGRQGFTCNCNFFDGKIDDVSIWDRQITQAEIQAHLAAQLTGSEPQLIAHFNFNEEAACEQTGSNNVNDVSPNSFIGNLINFDLGDNCNSNWSYGRNLDSDGNGVGDACQTLEFCYPNLDITNLQVNNVDFESASYISSNQVIVSPSQVDYDATTEILLLQDFEVKLGAIFHAFIDGCGGQ